MSGIGELAYTLLLGWMRSLFDWLWSIFSGTGSSGVWQWFLNNWKVWLVILVVGGLVVDWLMWLVRWRPYRVLFGKKSVAAGPAEEELWDSGVGYYEPETAVDSEPVEWTDLTLHTLSEIDPDWAGGVVMDSEPSAEPLYPNAGYYHEGYEEPPKAAVDNASSDGYWEETPDELPYAPGDETASSAYYEDPDWEDEAEEAPVPAYAEAFGPSPSSWAEPEAEEAPPDFEPGPEPAAPPWEAEAEAYTGSTSLFFETDAPDSQASASLYARPVQEAPRYDDPSNALPEPAEEAPASGEDTGPLFFGRPGLWPGAFPFAQEREAEDAEAPAPAGEAAFTRAAEEASPAGPTEQPRRRRRRLRESAYETWQSEDPLPFHEPPKPSVSEPGGTSMETNEAVPQDTRPSRVVRPAGEQPAAPRGKKGKRRHEEPKTVLGKPAKRKGLMRFSSSQDEPLAGLPPLDLTDPFLPAAVPENIDFAPDEGEEFE